MNIAGLRSIGSALLLGLLAGAGCNRPKRASSESRSHQRWLILFSLDPSSAEVERRYISQGRHWQKSVYIAYTLQREVL
jgi:hypothetical protein